LRCQQACFRQSHHIGAKALHRYFPFNSVRPKANLARILNDKCYQSYLSIRTKVYRTEICLLQVRLTHPSLQTRKLQQLHAFSRLVVFASMFGDARVQRKLSKSFNFLSAHLPNAEALSSSPGNYRDHCMILSTCIHR